MRDIGEEIGTQFNLWGDYFEWHAIGRSRQRMDVGREQRRRNIKATEKDK